MKQGPPAETADSPDHPAAADLATSGEHYETARIADSSNGTSPPRRALRAVPAALAALIPTGGLIAYAILKGAYSAYYAELGLRPEDVGLGYGDILGQSLIGLVILALVLVAIGPLAYLAFAILWQLGVVLVAILTKRPCLVQPHPPFVDFWCLVDEAKRWDLNAPLELLSASAMSTGLRPVWMLVLAAVFTGAVAYGNSVLPEVTREGAAIRNGRTIDLRLGSATGLGQPVEGWLNGVTLISWGTQAATPIWAPDAPGDLKTRSPDCIMYLGRAGDTTVLYDVTRKDTLRDPTSLVTIAISPDQRGC